MATTRPVNLHGDPDQELMEQGASRHSRSRTLGPLEQAGLLSKRDYCGEHGSWAPEASWGPRSRANGAPWSKQGSRSKDNGPLELGALNQGSMGLHRVLYSGPQLGPYTMIPAGISYNESRTAPQAVGSAGPSDCRPQPGSQTAVSSRHRPGPQPMVTGRTFIRRPPGRANIMRSYQALSKRTQTRFSIGEPQPDLTRWAPTAPLNSGPNPDLRTAGPSGPS